MSAIVASALRPSGRDGESLLGPSIAARGPGGLVAAGVGVHAMPLDLELIAAACLFLLGSPNPGDAQRRLRAAVDAMPIAGIPADQAALMQFRVAAEMALRDRRASGRRVAVDVLARQLTEYCAFLRARSDRPEAVPVVAAVAADLAPGEARP